MNCKETRKYRQKVEKFESINLNFEPYMEKQIMSISTYIMENDSKWSAPDCNQLSQYLDALWLYSKAVLQDLTLMWIGLNSLVNTGSLPIYKISCLPPINEFSISYYVVLATLKTSQKIAEEYKQQYTSDIRSWNLKNCNVDST